MSGSFCNVRHRRPQQGTRHARPCHDSVIGPRHVEVERTDEDHRTPAGIDCPGLVARADEGDVVAVEPVVTEPDLAHCSPRPAWELMLDGVTARRRDYSTVR
jgi:hypothetical protein